MSFTFTISDLVEIKDHFSEMIKKRIELQRIETRTGNIAWVFGIRIPNTPNQQYFRSFTAAVGPDPEEKIANALGKGIIVARTGLSSAVVVDEYPELLEEGDFPWQGGVLIGQDFVSAVSGCTPPQDEILATDLGDFANKIRRRKARESATAAQAGEGDARFIHSALAARGVAHVGSRLGGVSGQVPEPHAGG